ncbi:hypothetical protein F2Q69_00053698 [Brassica cretica]|uniref:RING-type domain-containing protein n=1 Tax=Brassica cretica TaxID=69181 RepID=A0A8S9MYD4_BRACR|nr:hypothetical protein F2Q69_00053698 [Brassica cretica]
MMSNSISLILTVKHVLLSHSVKETSTGRQSIDVFPNNIPRGRTSIDLGSDVGYERGNMLRPSTDGFRISVSSTPSCSSGGSGPDDIESLGDVYVWGEVWSDGILPDGTITKETVKTDVLTPRPLESNVVLDVHQIVCGVRHVALVTRQGEVFTWGEEAGGRLGHGIQVDISRPKLVEFLALTNIDFVACGEYHTCVVSTSGDLFSWGDGIHNVGLLGHGSDISHWIPKRVSGPLEGLQVLSVACGTWHSALATANGKLFTFGDGAFGVLGHGNRESVSCPKEVQSLNGLKTVKVACNIWHTVAIVEVMGQTGTNMSSRKLFTWGDGDKNRLGHGNKETYLLPTCVSSLIDYNFHQIACGHTFTVALTTSGHVFTMGGTSHGQLGNSISDGKLPCLVQDRLVGEFVEEIACGDHHVAVLTSRSEVFTWGKGANGRLGHGDTDDRRTPTLVEALRDRHVKSLSCGSNFTSSICIHKWVSGADQSICSGCRQAFGFTRKRHNCYNCGLVHCHACSSKKALKAALAPTPGKPHRVCDACYSKLKAAESGYISNGNRTSVATPGRSMDGSVRIDKGTTRSSKVLSTGNNTESGKTSRLGVRPDASSVRASQVPSLQQLKDIAFPASLTAIQNALKPAVAPAAVPARLLVGPMSSPPPARSSSPLPARSSSPYARRSSPPRTSGFSRSVIDSLKKTNEVMNQEMTKLQSQVKNLKQKCNNQGTEIQRFQKAAKEAFELAAKQSSKHKSATEALKSVAEQLKGLKEKLPPEVSESEAFEWVVIIPTSSIYPKPYKFELVVYASLKDAQPRVVMALRNPHLKEPEEMHPNTSVTIVDNDNTKIFSSLFFLTEKSLKLAPSIEEGRQQLKWFCDACKGIPQPVRPPVVVQTVLPSAPPLADYDTEAVEEGPMHYPLSGSTTPSASVGGGNTEDGGSSGQCLICMDAPSDGICVPCGHVAGCMSCLTQIKSHASECPICRANIHQVMKVYRV